VRRHLLVTLLVALASAMLAGLGSVPVAAARLSWTITPGGSLQTVQVDKPSYLIDSTTLAKFTCDPVGVTGTFKSGSGLHSPLGTVTNIYDYKTGAAPIACTGGGQRFTITFSSQPLEITAGTYSSNGETHGKFTGIDATLAASSGAPACSATLDGSAPGADNGWQRYRYYNSGELAIFPGAENLHAYNVTGCGINNGDGLTFHARLFVQSTSGVVDTITNP
jgi:hypothetical protein